MRSQYFFVIGFLMTGVGMSADWTQWRGPQRNGQTIGIETPDVWPEELAKLWENEAGEGYAGPLVKGDRIYLFARTGESEQVAAYALSDGRQIWLERYAAPFEQSSMARQHGNGPFATPAIAGDILLTIGMTEILSAFDLETGALKWCVDFPKNHEGGGNVFGSASAPLVEGNRCLVQVARNKGGALYCLDVNTGEIQWRQDNDGQASTPLVVVDMEGEKQVLAKSSKGVAGFSLAEGNPLWRMAYSIRYDHPIVTPICEGNQIIFGDYSRETSMIALEKVNGAWTSRVVWENKDISFYMASPVKVGSRIIGFTDKGKGRYVCLDAKTGKEIWTTDGRLGENAMMVAAGNAVFGLTPDGQLRVMDSQASTYQELANYKISDLPTWGPAVVLEDGVLVKDTQKLKRLTWR